MPNKYNIKPDGKLHVRYSQLKKCTPNQMEQLLKEMYNIITPFEGTSMALGSLRHEQFDAECKETGKLPKVYGLDLAVTASEYELSNEILPGVILHSTIDAYLAGDYVADFKTTAKSAKDWTDVKQLHVYAYQLSLQDVKVKRLMYLLEVWDRERESILSWEKMEREIKPEDLISVAQWLKDKVDILQTAIPIFEKEYASEINQAQGGGFEEQGSESYNNI